MRIVRSDVSQLPSFNTIACGDVFEAQNPATDQVYMKIEEYRGKHESYNCVSLITGRPYFYSTNRLVRPLDAELRIL